MRTRNLLLTVLVMACIGTVLVQSADAGNFDLWNKKLKLHFTGYQPDVAVTGFPLLVILDTGISNFSYSQFSSPIGGDLRFADSTETIELPYEIEEWDTGGTSYVWVRVPVLTSNATIQAYWGNADETTLPT